MGQRFVLDTSVAAAWYLPESFADAARVWQRQMLRGEVELYVPSLHDWEFANVLRTYVRRGELDRATAEDIQRLHMDAPLKRADPDRTSILQTALDYDCTAYDAVYIQLALALDCGLITAERTTTPWVVRLGKRVARVG